MPQLNTGAEVRVMLVDDHAMVRAGLQMLLEECGDFAVVGEAGTISEALALAAREVCDVFLIDLDLGGQDGSALIEPLLAMQPQSQILMLASLREIGAMRQVATLGARGILMKEDSSATLIKAVDCVHRGELWMDRSLVASLIRDWQRGPENKTDPHALKIGTLTRRERDVVALIGEGLKNKEIARRLFISETTVRHHLTSVFAKLEVSDRLSLVIYAFRHALIAPLAATKA